MGMIYKRGRIYWIKYYRHGKPYRESARSTKEAEAKRLLKKHKYIKVRLLRSAMLENSSKDDIVQKLCLSTGAKMVGIRGNTAVIYKI